MKRTLLALFYVFSLSASFYSGFLYKAEQTAGKHKQEVQKVGKKNEALELEILKLELDLFDSFIDGKVTINSSTVQNWQVSTYVDPIDDSENFLAYCREVSSGMFGSSLLVFEVLDGIASFSIRFAIVERNDDKERAIHTSRVTVRIGKLKAQAQTWEKSKESEDVMTYPGKIADLVKCIGGSERFAVRIELSDGNNLTSVFNTKGLSKIIPHLKKAKNWQPSE